MRWNSNQWVSVLVANHVDPSSGMKGNILRALAQYRREKGKINFGTFFMEIQMLPRERCG